MFQLASIRQSSSDSLEIPELNTSARIVPMSSPVALAEKERDPAISTIPERSEWPDFHCGVNAALRLDLERGKPVYSSQISFNRPAELDARHAGLLLGLGLNGQLGSMLSSQAYDYLKAKHDPTSVAILLGLAVTFLGTSDPTVTSVISIHLPALHPPRSSSLNVSGMTKSAAAVALGYLHFATGRRSLADVLVREMCGVKVTNVEDASACREAYALSCGFAFGFIMLGQGGKAGSTTTSSNEVDLLRVFRALILGENNRPLPGAFYPSQSSNAPIDVNITSSAATIGLALMFIRSERQDVANVFEIPDSPRRLDYVRSDVLLLRSLGRGLVMWNSVTTSKEWIESSLPPFLAVVDPNKPMDSELEVARWSVIAGACFAVGFKFAGTATAEAHATLIHYMDRLTRACYVKGELFSNSLSSLVVPPYRPLSTACNSFNCPEQDQTSLFENLSGSRFNRSLDGNGWDWRTQRLASTSSRSWSLQRRPHLRLPPLNPHGPRITLPRRSEIHSLKHERSCRVSPPRPVPSLPFVFYRQSGSSPSLPTPLGTRSRAKVPRSSRHRFKRTRLPSRSSPPRRSESASESESRYEGQRRAQGQTPRRTNSDSGCSTTRFDSS